MRRDNKGEGEMGDRQPNTLYQLPGPVKRRVTVKKVFKKIGERFDPETAPQVENIYTFNLDENFTLEDLRRKGMVEIDVDKADPAGYAEMKRLVRDELEAEIRAELEGAAGHTVAVEVDKPHEPGDAAQSIDMEVGGAAAVQSLAARCEGQTAKGPRCKKSPLVGGTLCKWHANKQAETSVGGVE